MYEPVAGQDMTIGSRARVLNCLGTESGMTTLGETSLQCTNCGWRLSICYDIPGLSERACNSVPTFW